MSSPGTIAHSRRIIHILQLQIHIQTHLTDIAFLCSDKDNADKPISCGFYRLEKGTPLVYTYTYDEMKIILEGQFQITDETGQTVTASPGDVFYFPKGAKITFTTENYGLAFYVSDPRLEGVSTTGMDMDLMLTDLIDWPAGRGGSINVTYPSRCYYTNDLLRYHR